MNCRVYVEIEKKNMAECGEYYGIVLTFINIVISCLTRKISMSSKEILFFTIMIVCFIYILICPP